MGTSAYRAGHVSLAGTELENAAFEPLGHQCEDIQCWAVTCGGAESQCEASFPWLQPEDVASSAPRNRGEDVELSLSSEA